MAGAGVREGPKTLAGVVGSKKVRYDALRVAGTRICRSAMSTFEAPGVEPVEGLQIWCHGTFNFAGIISRGSCRSSCASALLFRGGRYAFEASAEKSLKRIVILIELQSLIFEGCLVEKLCL